MDRSACGRPSLESTTGTKPVATQQMQKEERPGRRVALDDPPDANGNPGHKEQPNRQKQFGAPRDVMTGKLVAGDVEHDERLSYV